MSHCRYLRKVQHVVEEIGETTSPTELPPQWDCELGLSHLGMEWGKCLKTPVRGPCWQMEKQFETVEEWEAWANSQLA